MTTKKTNLKKKAYAAVMSLIMASASSIIYTPTAQAAGTPEGTIIGNQATATYKDAGNNSFTSTSNLVTTIITAVYSFVLTPDSTNRGTDASAQLTPGQEQNSTAGNIVYFPYTLVNNSNTEDDYNLVAIKGSATTAGLDPQNLEVYIDANGNGFIDVGDSRIINGVATVSNNGTPLNFEDDITLFTPGATLGTVSNVPADGVVKLIVKYQVPSGALDGNNISIDLRARSTSVSDNSAQADSDAQDPNNRIDSRNYSKVNISNDAVIAVTKAVDKATANPGDDLEYTFTITNTGNQTAKNIRLIDVIPKNITDGRITDFVVGQQTASEGTFSFADNAPANPDPDSDFDYTPTATATDANVNFIKYDLASLDAGNTRTVKFKVRIRSVLSEAKAGIIPNNGAVAYDNTVTYGGPGDTTPNVKSTTNTVNTEINKKVGTLITVRSDAFAPQTFTSLADIDTITDGDGVSDQDEATTDRTTQATAPSNSYVFFKQEVFNRGNAPDTFNITTASNTFPAGSVVNYYQLTDPTNPANNTSPLLDTNGDSLIDTGVIPAGSSKIVVARVFIPSNAAAGGTATVTATSTNGGTSIAAAAGYTLSDTTRDTVTTVQPPEANLENYIDAGTTERGFAQGANPNTAVRATASANGTTVSYPVTVENRGGSVDTFNLTGSLSGVNLPGAVLEFYPIDTKTRLSASAIAGATTVSVEETSGLLAGDKIVINGQTLTIATVSSISGPGNITFTSGTGLYEAASQFETVSEPSASPITSSTAIAAATPFTTLAAPAILGATSVTLTNASSVGVDDIIKIGNDYLTIASKVGNVVSFVNTQALTAPAILGTQVQEISYQEVLAVVNVPAGTPPIPTPTSNVTLTITSTNDNTKTDTVTNHLLIPDFRDFTLVANRSGTAAAGTVLFYDHILTNVGNSNGDFDLSIINDGLSPNFSYQLLDSVTNNPITATITNIAPGGTYKFKVKVTVPAGTPPTTVDNITVQAVQVSGSTKTNIDTTTVVAGFIQLTKTVRNTTILPAELANTSNTAIPGDILEYVIDYSNVGSDIAYDVILTDLIPANTTYVPNSLEFDPDGTSGAGGRVARTDAAGVTEAGNCSAERDAVDNSVKFFVGTGQTATTGGQVPSGGKGAIIFRVQVN